MAFQTQSGFEHDDFYTDHNMGGQPGHPPTPSEFRANVRRRCSIIGFALCLMYILIQLVGLGVGLLLNYLSDNAVMGIGMELYKILDSRWFSVAGSSLLGYAVALPPMLLVLGRVPEIIIEPKKMRLKKFLMFTVIAMGFGYILNFVGTIINILIAFMTARVVNDMNPVMDLVSNLDFATALYISVIGPIVEEFIFRKAVLNRVRPLGEKAAILFSAILFGLLHGNIAQFLYATFIGVILGYIAVKTGHIFYCILLHILVNSYSTFISVALTSQSVSHPMLYVFLTLAVLAISFALVVAAIVLLIINVSKTRLRRGDVPEGIEYKDFSSAMFLNPGVITFIIICSLMVLYYAFLS